MFKRVLKRFFRTAITSAIGLALAKYGDNPFYGPIATTGLMTLDKLVREKLTVKVNGK